MKKNIKVYIKNNESELTFNCKSIYLENKKILKYQEPDKTNVTLNIKNNILIRENKDIYMEYYFINNQVNKSKLIIKSLNKEIALAIQTIKIISNNTCYEVEYEILDSKEHFIYKVTMEA